MKKHPSVLPCITCTSHAATRRTGHEHVYTLNGSRLRDLLVNGQWITVSVSAPESRRVVAWRLLPPVTGRPILLFWNPTP